MFKRILIANRGEIAVRVIRACRELGIETVAVYSEADRTALHVKQADYAYHVGPPPSAESYLVIDKILHVAREAHVDAIHPGYGFLSERALFARRCQEAGIVFIGPTPDAIERMGDKVAARALMRAAKVPVVPGSDGTIASEEEVISICRQIGFPVMLKAAAGGGGKGMRMVAREADLAAAVRGARSEARSSFGDDRMYVEKFVTQPRHVEIQVMADTHGNTVHLYERECSIQRRHQKVVEETPSPAITQEIREQMGAVAVQAAQAVNYVGAGTIEFLVDAARNFYFLEMNTRIQVEHAITEMVTGIDLVKTQILVAAGAPLPFTQRDIVQSGHAIECRIYAEDPYNKFFPSPGQIDFLQTPGGIGIRDDSGVYEGYEVSLYYDPMISKLIAWGRTREEAIQRMRRALDEYRIHGLTTNLAFHRWILLHPRFLAGDFDTNFIAEEFHGLVDGDRPRLREAALAAAAIAERHRERERSLLITTATPSAAQSAWRQAARRGALRD
ncbi:MAG: acetyl-CoA carboxylase biotin carboxylase subunit [Deltaproteobacteria bacterium]|nr:acetyl-CoA carboxylase biotin carboxylase subunit [Deltaproteobacteria bacterium]